MTSSTITRNWYKILGVFGFNLIAIWFLLKGFVPDLRQRLATIEIFGLVFSPMIIFYLRNNWSPVKWIINIVLISIIVIFTYGFIHESSHLIGVYLIGSKPIETHLIPHFWKGEFTTGWIRSETVNDWTGVLPSLFPYIKDIIFLFIGLLIFQKRKINNSFFAGFTYAFLCLAPLFDIVNNYLIKLILGKVEGNDFYGVTLGWGDTWANIIGMTFSIFAIFTCIWIPIFYKNVPMIFLVDNENEKQN
jgi:hypothetical protein